MVHLHKEHKIVSCRLNLKRQKKTAKIATVAWN